MPMRKEGRSYPYLARLHSFGRFRVSPRSFRGKGADEGEGDQIGEESTGSVSSITVSC